MTMTDDPPRAVGEAEGLSLRLAMNDVSFENGWIDDAEYRAVLRRVADRLETIGVGERRWGKPVAIEDIF